MFSRLSTISSGIRIETPKSDLIQCLLNRVLRVSMSHTERSLVPNCYLSIIPSGLFTYVLCNFPFLQMKDRSTLMSRLITQILLLREAALPAIGLSRKYVLEVTRHGM